MDVERAPGSLLSIDEAIAMLQQAKADGADYVAAQINMRAFDCRRGLGVMGFVHRLALHDPNYCGAFVLIFDCDDDTIVAGHVAHQERA